MASPNRKKRVYLVEDHPVVRRAVAALIEEAADLTLVGTASSAEEALAALERQPCDVLLVDVTLPKMGGIELVRQVVAGAPVRRCLMLTAHVDPALAAEALGAGARGYVVKDDADGLLGAIRRVLAGEVVVSEPARPWQPRP